MFRLVRAIRMLSLQDYRARHDGRVKPHPNLPLSPAFVIWSYRLELKDHLVGVNFHNDTACRRYNFRWLPFIDIAGGVQYPVMIVTNTVNQLRKRIVDICAYHYRFAKDPSACLPRVRYRSGSTSRPPGYMYPRRSCDRMIHDLRAGDAGKIKITMVCQIHDSRFIRRRLVVFNINGVIIRQLIDHLDIQITGKPASPSFDR